MSMIEDGTGSRRKAGVNSNNELMVKAVVTSEASRISEENSETFMFVTADFISITTTGVEHGILHLKNNNTEKHLHIESIRTCGTSIQKWKLYGNSTGGTLLTDETTGGTSNLNIDSLKTSSSDTYVGADGKTITGGVMKEHWVNDIGHAIDDYKGALILEVGASIQLTVELASVGDVCVRIIGYFQEN